MSVATLLCLLVGTFLSQKAASDFPLLTTRAGVEVDGGSVNASVAVMAQINDDDKCDHVMNVSAADRCAFVKNTPDCSVEDGFINYLQVAFCLLPPDLTPLTVILCIIWLFVLFVVLGLIASKFFCPNLSAISTSLHLTHNVAGVTFLALGNGAPDIFSAIAAFSRPHTAGLAVGALFGAGVFVTTIVAGGVALVKPFAVASRPFLRDVIFYMVAVFWTYLILFRRTTTLGETLGYLGLYVVYVLTVVISAYIYSRQKRLRSATIDDVPHIQAGFESSDSYDNDVPCLLAGTDQQEYESEYRPLLQYPESTSQILLSSLNPVDNRQWRRKNWKWRVIKVLKSPVEVILLLCIPVVDLDKEDKNWRRPLNCLHLVTAPLIWRLLDRGPVSSVGADFSPGTLPVCYRLLQHHQRVPPKISPSLRSFGLRGERSVDQRGGVRSGQHSAHARRGVQSQQHSAGFDSPGLGQQHRRLFLRHHSGTTGLPQDGHFGLLRGYHFQHVIWGGFGLFGAEDQNTL
ncbi:mitochondrial sodium/calcium exchanger protein isoform X3 [Festucalex cinctus]